MSTSNAEGTSKDAMPEQNVTPSQVDQTNNEEAAGEVPAANNANATSTGQDESQIEVTEGQTTEQEDAPDERSTDVGQAVRSEVAPSSDQPDVPGRESNAREGIERTTESADKENERVSIQNEAIQHLARRAADITVSPTHHAPITKDDKLPASPPPPPPPEKEKEIDKPTPETIVQAVEDTDLEKQALEDSNAQDIHDTTTGEQTGVEIQHIIDQFGEGQGAGEEEIMSPRLEKQQPILQLPPRTSSLEAEKHMSPVLERNSEAYFAGARSHRNSIISQSAAIADDTSSIRSHRTSIFQPPPPTPDPDPVLPFDFHRFLEQLRHRTADPVARYLRSFLQEFGKKNWMVHEQVKIIGDFLDFISKKMAQCEVWRAVSDAEFDNAREGMEKLVMNRLYTQTFSPAIPPPANSPRKKNARNADAGSGGNGRRGQHQEDVERDDVIAQKMRIYGWINEEHLDIKPIGEKGRKFLTMAQQELLKINTYRAPRDKVICVLNCCKVIFGFLKNNSADQSADAFVPLLIYTVLRARPEHLVSNVQYIFRFRNQDKLGGEAGYYMSSLMGVVTFLETLDRTMITITDEEFEKNVEQAVSAIAEGHAAEAYEAQAHTSLPTTPRTQHLMEKSASRPEVTARHSADVERSPPKKSAAQRLNDQAADSDETDAMTGLLRTIQKPLSSIGRIFSDEGGQQSTPPAAMRSSSSPLPPRTSSRNLAPALTAERTPSQARRSDERARLSSDEAEARQASVETAEIQRERQRGFGVVVETLQGMFPNLEKEIIEDVVRAQDGNIGRAVDACLALSDQA